MKSFKTSLITAMVSAALTAGAGAATIGAGTGILTLPGANNTFDTPSTGANDQSRQNLDDSFTVTLPAGTYTATSWTYQAGQTGSVIPYLARSTGADTYEVLAAGGQVDVTAGGLNTDVTVAFGGSNQFTLLSDTQIFAGIVNPTGNGSQNPVLTNLASGFTVDHDNNVDGLLSPAVVGGTVDGFGHANLARSYAFSIEVEPIPEPTSAAFSIFGFAIIALVAMRRRRRI